MSKLSRDKGRRGELEVLALLGDAGIEGELLYGQTELGGSAGDMTTTAGNFEVKRRAGLPAWLDPTENVRAVFVRRDRGPWLVVCRASDYLDLLAGSLKAPRKPHDATGCVFSSAEGAGMDEAAKLARRATDAPDWA